jgi:hypothetical protein
MRILAGCNFVLTTGVFLMIAWKALVGVTVVSVLTHFTLLTLLPIIAIGMFVVAFAPR